MIFHAACMNNIFPPFFHGKNLIQENVAHIILGERMFSQSTVLLYIRKEVKEGCMHKCGFCHSVADLEFYRGGF